MQVGQEVQSVVNLQVTVAAVDVGGVVFVGSACQRVQSTLVVEVVARRVAAVAVIEIRE